MLNNVLLTAETLTCRVMEHTPSNYAEAQQWDSVLVGEVTMVRASPKEEWAVATTDTNMAHLLSLTDNGTYSVYKTIQGKQGAKFNKVSFINNTIAVMGNGDGSYTLYDLNNDISQDENA